MRLTQALFTGIVLSVCAAALQSAPPKKADTAAGKAIFQEKCAECHNAESKETKNGPGFAGVKTGKLPSGLPATYEVIMDLVTKGQESMPAFKDVLSEKEREDVVAYVMTL